MVTKWKRKPRETKFILNLRFLFRLTARSNHTTRAYVLTSITRPIYRLRNNTKDGRDAANGKQCCYRPNHHHRWLQDFRGQTDQAPQRFDALCGSCGCDPRRSFHPGCRKHAGVQSSTSEIVRAHFPFNGCSWRAVFCALPQKRSACPMAGTGHHVHQPGI